MEGPTDPVRRRALARLVTTTLVGVAAFAAGVSADRTGLLPGSVVDEPPAVRVAFSPFWQAWDLVQARYVDRSAVSPIAQSYGAISGMLASLDDPGHTRFLSPQAYAEEQDALAGRLEGIGAEMTLRGGKPTVVAPISGSPAARAGLRAGDVIERVNGTDAAGMTLEQLVHLVRGQAGTVVRLTVRHVDETVSQEITITRAKITIPSVVWARLPGTAVADILVTSFAEHAGDELVAALSAARSGGAAAVVLDLRNDPGGLRDEAIAVASQFLAGGNVLLEQDAAGKRTAYPVKSGGVATDLPLAVLVNRGTASSAEIVAGALQDHHRGMLIGETTFGTGTVLSTYRLTDGSAIFLGTAEWFTPNGRQIWRHGIDPDIPVSLPSSATALTPDAATSLGPEALRASGDAQLLRALAELAKAAH